MVRCLNCMEIYDERFGVCPHCGFIPGTPPKEAYHLHPGMLLADRYTIGTVLGFGGFGITYRAWDRVLEKMVAIKEYYPNGIVNRIPGKSEIIIYSGERASEFQKGKERFLAEARNMARFSTHPNIVNVYAFFEANNTAYIVMEFLDGISFKQYIKDQGGRIEVNVAVEVALSVLDALKEIHRAKIIHRDISPDNIFICEGGVIKVIDFGAARFSTGDEEKTMSIILKPGYAPPEQYRSKSRQGPWTDIYAVGAVLYRAVTGVMPEESVNRMVEDTMKSPRELAPELPENLDKCIMRAMALNQELRFQNVSQFEEALQNKTAVRDVQSELKKRKMVRGVGVAAACTVILTAAGVCAWMYQSRMQSVNLKAATIEVWIPVDTGTDTDAEKKEKQREEAEASFLEALKDYETAYPQITVNVELIEAEDYERRIKEAYDNERDKGRIKETDDDHKKRMPDLFDSTVLGEPYDKSFASLKEVYELLEENKILDEYYALDEYREQNPELNKMPLSLQMPVVYVNAKLYGDLNTDEFIFKDDENYSCNPEDRPAFEKLFDVALEDNRGYEAFRSRDAAIYLGDTGDYRMVQRDMAGIYRIMPVKKEVEWHFSNQFSVWNESDKNEKAAAVRAVYYLLSENAQSAYNVRGLRGLPVNKNKQEQYFEVNTELQELKKCRPEGASKKDSQPEQ